MILVTGATGLVGSHVVLRLLENHQQVRAIYRNREAISKTKSIFLHYSKMELFDKIDWIQADITEIPSLEIAFNSVTQVYHCAAFISFDPKDENKLRQINIEGTANVVNFCLEYGIKKLCHVSSIAALGDLAVNETVVSETTEWNPDAFHSDYAISKYGGEMEIWRGRQEGLATVIVNPGVILGPLFWKTGSGAIYDKVAKGLLFYTKGATGFVTVTDVVSTMILLMNSEVCGEKYVVISEIISFETLLKTIATKLKVRGPYLCAGPKLTAVAWRIDWFLSHLFFLRRKLSKSLAKTVHKKEHFSNQKIKATLRFEFKAIVSYLLESDAVPIK